MEERLTYFRGFRGDFLRGLARECGITYLSMKNKEQIARQLVAIEQDRGQPLTFEEKRPAKLDRQPTRSRSTPKSKKNSSSTNQSSANQSSNQSSANQSTNRSITKPLSSNQSKIAKPTLSTNQSSSSQSSANQSSITKPPLSSNQSTITKPPLSSNQSSNRSITKPPLSSNQSSDRSITKPPLSTTPTSITKPLLSSTSAIRGHSPHLITSPSAQLNNTKIKLPKPLKSPKNDTNTSEERKTEDQLTPMLDYLLSSSRPPTQPIPFQFSFDQNNALQTPKESNSKQRQTGYVSLNLSEGSQDALSTPDLTVLPSRSEIQSPFALFSSETLGDSPSPLKSEIALKKAKAESWIDLTGFNILPEGSPSDHPPNPTLEELKALLKDHSPLKWRNTVQRCIDMQFLCDCLSSLSNCSAQTAEDIYEEVFFFFLDLLNEYSRFLALKAVLCTMNLDHLIFPSGRVEECWQYHILNTDAYHRDCIKIFGKVLEYSLLQKNRVTQERDTLLSLYEYWFMDKPCEIWNSPQEVINPDEYMRVSLYQIHEEPKFEINLQITYNTPLFKLEKICIQQVQSKYSPHQVTFVWQGQVLDKTKSPLDYNLKKGDPLIVKFEKEAQDNNINGPHFSLGENQANKQTSPPRPLPSNPEQNPSSRSSFMGNISPKKTTFFKKEE